MPRKVAACLLACALVSTSASAKILSDQIASTSLCGDSYLLALLEGRAEDRLSALSWQSRHDISTAPAHLRTRPQAWDETERLLTLSVGHIVYGSGEGYAAESFLDKAGIAYTRLNWSEDFQGVFDNITALGEALGLENAARRLNAQTQMRLTKLGNTSPKRVLYLSRSGGSAGPGTYVDAAIKTAGGINVITAPGWVNPDTETLLSLKPDLIVTSFFEDGYASINAAPIRHKTLRAFMDQHERLDIPGAVWPCAGPGLIDAAEMIHAKLEDLK